MNANIINTKIPGCFELQPQIFEDKRGRFVKTFHKDIFLELGFETSFSEDYYSISEKGVLRGLHFQIPPYEHTKLVYCVEGRVFDGVLDLRRNSPTYRKYDTFELEADKANMLYIPPGLAHGILILSEWAIMIYKVSTVYSPEHDTGILWNSTGIPWPDKNPIVSNRDQGFQMFDDFKSPFYFNKNQKV